MPDTTKTILIIEDDKQLLDSYKELVESAGYTCLTAVDGYHGLDTMSQQQGIINLVLLDLMMPGIDGLEVLRAVKANPDKYGDIPVVVLTNMTSDAVIKEAFDLGASSYLVKTDIDYEGLVKELNKYLGE